jgi:hypothetical protein
MPSSGILRRVALVRTDISEELSASIISVARIGELGTLASSETLVLTRETRRNIPEDGILHLKLLSTAPSDIRNYQETTICARGTVEEVFCSLP